MALLVFYLALALGVSFLCSLLEASMLSVSMGHVSALASKGAAGARLMQLYKERPDRPLAAILSSNTVAHTVGAAAVVTYTTSGSTTLRAARERPEVPILCLTSNQGTARCLALCWGVHSVHTEDVKDFQEMIEKASALALRDGLASHGDRLVVTAGVPFGTPGNTNVLRIAWVDR